MSMVINTNVASLASQRHLASSRADMEQAMERLSSGKRINSAADDAAGLSISHSLESRIASLSQAVRNGNDGIALVNLAEGALEEISTMITRMKELATQAVNGTYNDSVDRAALDDEFQALLAQITDISDQTTFNGNAVVGGTDTYTFQMGTDSGDTITFTAVDMDLDAAGGDLNGQDLTDATNAALALTALDTAMSTVDGYRSTLGATSNRLEHAVNNLMSRVEHQSAALSRIQDADYAVESANLARAQVLQQAGTAMLSQANASTQNVLSLLK